MSLTFRNQVDDCCENSFGLPKLMTFNFLTRSAVTTGNEEDILYIAGGADRQGKSIDVRKLVLENTSQNYLRWNELIPR